jgi:hypothetical protein
VVPELAMWRATRSAGEPYGPRMSLMRARSRVVLRFVRRRRLADGATFALDASLLPLAPTTNYGYAIVTPVERYFARSFSIARAQAEKPRSDTELRPVPVHLPLLVKAEKNFILNS